jgi:predicted HTH transcriptional regulator
MRKALADSGLPEPQFSFDDFFRVTFNREYEAVNEAVNEAVKKFGEKFGVKFGEKFGVSVKRAKRLAQIFYLVYSKEWFTVDYFAKEQEISVRQIEKDMQFLTKKGLITFIGAPKTGQYNCTKVGNAFMSSLMNNTE